MTASEMIDLRSRRRFMAYRDIADVVTAPVNGL
jgi:hypothetical protein